MADHVRPLRVRVVSATAFEKLRHLGFVGDRAAQECGEDPRGQEPKCREGDVGAERMQLSRPTEIGEPIVWYCCRESRVNLLVFIYIQLYPL